MAWQLAIQLAIQFSIKVGLYLIMESVLMWMLLLTGTI